MTIKINGDIASINIWTYHPLMLGALKRLPEKVLDLLHPEIRTKEYVNIVDVKSDIITETIDYRCGLMRKKLDKIQVVYKVVTSILCFAFAMGIWLALYQVRAGIVMTSLIGSIAVTMMVSIFARRYTIINIQDKALEDVYVYLVKEHRYMYMNMYQQQQASMQELTDMFNKINESSIEYRCLVKKDREAADAHVDNLEKQLYNTRDSYQKILTIYQDVIAHTDGAAIENHIERCNKLGIEIVYDNAQLIHFSDNIH